MSKRETLAEKKAVSEAVVQETLRCLKIVKALKSHEPYNLIIERIVNEHPLLPFYPELRKQI